MEPTQTNEETINSTQNVSETQNPQGATSSPANSNDAEDFQSTAPETVLNEEVQSLSVTETGEPLTGMTPESASNMDSIIWGGLILIGVILVTLIIRKLIQDGSYTDTDAIETPAVSATKTTKTTKIAAKKTAKKKPVTTKKRKKTTKRR